MNCKNCNKTLKDSQKFCDECGAKVIQNRLSPKILATQVNEQFISIDNKFLRTFIDLFRKPDEVINGYINGTRKKYIDVLQYFAISLTLGGIQVFLMTTFFSDALEFSPEFMQSVESMPEQKDNPFLGLDYNDFAQYQSLMYILMVPFSAFGTWIVYYFLGNKRFNFTEHLVINLYYSGEVIIVTSIFSVLFLFFGLNYIVIYTILTIPSFLYFGFVLKRVFKESFWDTFGKFILAMIVYIVSYFILMLIIGLTIGLVLAIYK